MGRHELADDTVRVRREDVEDVLQALPLTSNHPVVAAAKRLDAACESSRRLVEASLDEEPAG